MTDLTSLVSSFRCEIETVAEEVGIDFSQTKFLVQSGKQKAIPINKKDKGKVAIFVNQKSTREGEIFYNIVFFNFAGGGKSATWSSYGKVRDQSKPAPKRPPLRIVEKKEKTQTAIKEKIHSRYKADYEMACSFVPSFDYFERKGVHAILLNPALKLMEDKYGPFIAMPLYSPKGDFVGLQRIYDNSKKLTPAVVPGQFKGAHFILGEITEGCIIYIAEGLATAASVHLETDQPVVVALNAQNLIPVTSHVAEVYGDHSIIIAADNDAGKDGNPGLLKALEAARYTGAKISRPPSVDGKAIDWNDFALSSGIRNEISNKNNFIAVPRTSLLFKFELLKYARRSDLKKLIREITKLSLAPFFVSIDELTRRIHEQIPLPYDLSAIYSLVQSVVLQQRHFAAEISSIKPKSVSEYLEIDAELNDKGHWSIPNDLVRIISGLENSICIVRSPMGTGKTEILMKGLLEIAEKGAYIAPRRSLVSDCAKRLGLSHYEGMNAIEALYCNKLACCINSIGMEKFAPTLNKLDILCLDEAIQALPQIPSLGRADAKKANYEALALAVKTSKLTLICDATANEYLVEQLKKIAPEKNICLIDVKVPDPVAKDIGFTTDLMMARSAALDAVCKGTPLLIATDSKMEAQRIERLLIGAKPNLRILNIHREPSLERKVAIERFYSDPNQVATEYDALIYSPAITSGLSLTVPHFKTHISIFIGVVGTTDIIQMMGRDRTATKWLLCINDKIHQLQKGYREMESGLLKIAGEISGFDYLNLASIVYEANAKQDLAAKTLHILTEGGHHIRVLQPINERQSKSIAVALKEINRSINEARIDLIKNQEIISDESYQRLQQDWMLTEEDKAKIDAYRIANQLCSDVHEKSIEFYDNNGLSKIRLHEALIDLNSNGSNIKAFDKEELDKEASLRFYAEKKALIIQKTLEILGVSTDDFTGEFNHENCRNVIDYFSDESRRVEFNFLGLSHLFSDHPPKSATCWVRNFLKKLGLRLGKRKSHGRMIRFIDPQSWAEVKNYLDARREFGVNAFQINNRLAA